MIKVAAALLAGSTSLIAMQPTFSSRIEGVRIDVLVTDASRRPLRGLTAQDFVIRDNGAPIRFRIWSRDAGGSSDASVIHRISAPVPPAGARRGVRTTRRYGWADQPRGKPSLPGRS
jgi:hypothetical protein